MSKTPEFRLYGQGDPNIEENIQPILGLRQWADLQISEREIALQELKNKGWLNLYSREILHTIEYLNDHFLRQCPGQRLHKIQPSNELHNDNTFERIIAATTDFQDVFLHEKSSALVLRMLTKFAKCHIDRSNLNLAEKAETDEEKNKYIAKAFKNLDNLSNCLNHVFEQFSVNVLMTRNGLVPRQDENITEEIYVPTLKALSDPKWKNVNDDLAQMFIDYREERYPEAVTKAHRAIQKFFQILVGKEGKNSKGELANLFKDARNQQLIPINRFTEPIINVFQNFIPAERATKSTAKPSVAEATSSDALLIMNVVMVFLQHCLQKNK